jgi:hypothetical protein
MAAMTSLHVDVSSELLNARLHVLHHVVEATVEGDWSVFMIQLDEKV